MQNKRENFLNTKRDAWVEINLGNIENNMPHGYGVYETKNSDLTLLSLSLSSQDR